MQIDSSASRKLLETQLSNVLSQTIGSEGTSDTVSDFAELMDGLLGKGTSASPASMPAANASKAPFANRSLDGLLWLQLGSAYAADAGTYENTYASANSPEVSLNASTNVSSADSGSSVPTDFESLIAAASAKYGVPESLIKAVIDTESSFNPNVVSSAGAKGLMQLMDGTAAGLGVSDPFDPAQNIDAGTKYLSLQLQRFGGQVNMALAAYNAGPGRVTKLGVSTDSELMSVIDRLPAETQAYIAKVEKARQKYIA